MLIPQPQTSSPKKLWIVFGITFVVALILILMGTYGYLLKTQVDFSPTQYSSSGTLKTGSLQPGAYTLVFTGKNAQGAKATSSTSFTILGSTPLPY